MVASSHCFHGTLWCGYYTCTALMPSVLAAMIPLLPGMDLTTAARELSTGHVVSGSSRLAFTVTIFALLAFGLVLGGMGGQAVVGPVELVLPIETPLWLSTAGILAAAIGLMLLIQAPARDAFWILCVTMLAWAGAQFGEWINARSEERRVGEGWSAR